MWSLRRASRKVSAGKWLGLALAAATTAGCGNSPSADPGVTPPPPYDVTATLDVGTRYQVMQGFGGSLGFYVNWLTGHPQRDQIYNLIFSDLGLQVLRIGNWYQNTSPSSFTDAVSAVTAARASLGHDPVLLISSWSPPASLKSNGMTKMGGTLAKGADGAYRYADFGQWWANSLAAFAAAGVHPTYISIQNEPDYVAQTWESCLFDPAESDANAGYDKALQAVVSAIGAAGLDSVPKLIGPETSGIAGEKVQSYVSAVQAGPGLDELDGVAHHLYSGGTAASPSSFSASMSALADMAAASDKPLFMTEYSITTDMIGNAWLINNAVTVEGVSAYFVWSLTWAPPSSGLPGGLVTTEFPGAQSMWKTANGYTVNDSYYAVRHFSKWIDVGWQRVALTTSEVRVMASAFLSPDGQQATIVLINIDSRPHGVTLDAGSFAFASSAVYRSSGTDERTAPLGSLAGPLDLPGSSIATITLGP
jgi:O-glycosyl hydrolase